ncbi:hypothetical protein CEUSTIGMA_g5976.t1 [Chlamydomonas eustigma]|uniref:Uncharacterized protein n=1 Tax=Chlamydomonas eustigma TaxID=1157962 RepID=A0A250X665_9CHLO|nr:hypothetical protein CEUSTIGMA_g5976.t1 [Chlamydomonas eustigma]|eukprot:GAX78536.1 hypothetical protein CEUSTIGMA_g5976.t1 [Chlamydomonas eustigma]
MEEEGTTSWAVPKIMKLVKSASLFWRAPIGRILDGAAERRFEYEEEVDSDNSEDFFVPYIWGLLLPRLPVCWELDTAEERNEKPVHMSRHCT